MSWDKLNTATDSKALEKQAEQIQKKALEMAIAFNECFESPAGQKVLEHLTSRFIFDNDTMFESPNVNYEAAYHNGEAGVVKFIINQIQQAKARG